LKKYLALILGLLLVLSFAAVAFAVPADIPAKTQAVVAKGSTQITLGGAMRVRGWYTDNLGNYGGGPTGVPRESNSKANYDQRVRLDIGVKASPNVQGLIQMENTGGGYTWDAGPNVKPESFTSFRQAWMDYSGSDLFGFKSGFRIGHQLITLGNGIFYDSFQYGDNALKFYMDPTKELHVELLTIKAAETFVGKNTDDMDLYVALMTYKWDPKNTVGINYTYGNQSNIAMKGQNLGIHANGNIEGIGYKAEADIHFGSVGELAAKAKFKGYGLMLGANYNLDPVNIRGMFAYGSGDKPGTLDKDEGFQTFVGRQRHYSFVYEYRANAATGARGTGIENTTVFNLGADYTIAKDLRTSLDGYFLRANKVAAGASKNIGWEVDAQVKYNLAKNLSYAVTAGYLKAGKFYPSTPAAPRKSATVLLNELTLSF